VTEALSSTGRPPADYEPVPLGLFEFLRVVAVAVGRGKLTRGRAAVAMLAALSSSGTSGSNATVKAKALATELDVSERQVWRHFRALVDEGWFEQTAKPTRGYKGERGRVARYRLTSPRVWMAGDNSDNRVPDPSGEASHGNAGIGESSDTFTPNRVTLSAEPSATTTPESGTVSPSYGSTSDGLPLLESDSCPTTDRARDIDLEDDDEVNVQTARRADAARAALLAGRRTT
jgi:hypothetical protein